MVFCWRDLENFTILQDWTEVMFLRNPVHLKFLKVQSNSPQNNCMASLWTPPPPNQGWENGALLPFARLHPWFGGDGGLLFHFILSKIVALSISTVKTLSAACISPKTCPALSWDQALLLSSWVKRFQGGKANRKVAHLVQDLCTSIACVSRLFTVLYFAVRSPRSSAMCYGLPSCMSVKTT